MAGESKGSGETRGSGESKRTRPVKEPLRPRRSERVSERAAKREVEPATPSSRRSVASAKATEKAMKQANEKATVTATSKRTGRSRSRPASKEIAEPSSKNESSKTTKTAQGAKKRGFFRRHVKGIAFLVLFPPLVGVGALLWYASTIPLPPDSVAVETSFVYTEAGEELAAFKADTDRTDVALADVPLVMRNAVLASEDKAFYTHRGVDPLSIGRAIYRDLRSQGVQQGGSTLTQQYVKITYTGRERSYKRKLREAILSVKLERRLDKDQIFQRYLNSVYFGRGATGVQAAARAYFEKDAKSLTLAESAYLAGVLRAPENTDAKRNPERAKFRRDSVLTNMAKLGFIDESERVTATSVPLTGVGGIVRAKPTSTVNFTDVGPEFAVDMIRRELIAKFGAPKVFGGGLRVTTTLDLKAQGLARKTLFTDVLNRASDPDAAMVVLDHDGRVRALVGGRSWAQSQVNLAAGKGYGGSGRQAGSTFKPFVLAAAVREGISVNTPFPAPKNVVIPGANVDGTDWEVSNFDDIGYASDIDLTQATAESVNTVYAQLVVDERVGAERVAVMAKDLGIRSKIDAYPALALGTEEVSPLEMADAYLTFAREGSRVEPFLISKVTDATGQVLFEHKSTQVRVLSSDEAAIMNQTLRQVVEAGSGVKAKLDDGRQVAGKTGTTQNARDAWFVGYTPKNCCVVAVWMGFATSNKPMVKLRGRRVTGGAFPADLFSRFMNVQVANVDTGEFELPSEEAVGEVIVPKRTKSPVKRKKPKVIEVQDAQVEDPVAPEDGDDSGPAEPATETPTPTPEPVPVPAEETPAPEPVAPPPVQVDAPPPVIDTPAVPVEPPPDPPVEGT
jgi:membrane peptidoglycan carboxypeptidase